MSIGLTSEEYEAEWEEAEAKYEKLEAENGRLREALTRLIDDNPCTCDSHHDYTCPECEARQALKGGEE